MMHRRPMPFLALALFLGVWLAGTAAARGGPDSASPPASVGFVGTWYLLSQTPGQAPAPALLTFVTDGTLLGTGLPVQPAGSGVVFISAGQGIWQQTGEATATASLVLLVVDARGSFRGTETDQLQLSLSADGRHLQGQFVASVAAPTGQLEHTLSGTVQGTRIMVGPPGTPQPGTPAA